MKFKELCSLLEKNHFEARVYLPCDVKDKDPEIDVLVSDSRVVTHGTMFACVSGGHADGHDFAAGAVDAGACALMCERELPLPVPQIICSDIRRNMGVAASLLYGTPLEKLTMVALTGTNGKTTSTFMLKSILEASGTKTGLLGTVFYDDGDVVEEAVHTTPEGSDLQFWLSRMVKNGCKACIMETSSHSVSQGRIDGVLYDRAGFTNLSVDHLDFHGDMENYFQAKRTLFTKYMRNGWKCAVNIDDEYGKRLFSELKEHAVSYGIEDKNADFSASIKGVSIKGLDAEIKTPCSDAPVAVRLPLLGKYNVYNALQALSLAWTLGVKIETAIDSLVNMKQVPGRLERYHIAGSGSCVIDFAHSPDGLEKVLTALRPVCRGRLCVVFGAGGDRDKTKRPLMGEIAGRLADMAIITSDNPRSEDPAVITLEIEAGAKKHDTEYKIIVDRREAIYAGLSAIAPEDILLIAGRGPERCQILKDGPVPLLDKDVVLDWCAQNGKEVL